MPNVRLSTQNAWIAGWQVISPRNHMVFTPLLASSCVGTVESRSVAVPIIDIQKALRSPQVRSGHATSLGSVPSFQHNGMLCSSIFFSMGMDAELSNACLWHCPSGCACYCRHIRRTILTWLPPPLTLSHACSTLA